MPPHCGETTQEVQPNFLRARPNSLNLTSMRSVRLPSASLVPCFTFDLQERSTYSLEHAPTPATTNTINHINLSHHPSNISHADARKQQRRRRRRRRRQQQRRRRRQQRRRRHPTPTSDFEELSTALHPQKMNLPFIFLKYCILHLL